MSICEARKSAFKKGIDREDARKKRDEKGIELRKNKREENLLKRRVLADPQPSEEWTTDADGAPTGASRVPLRSEIPALVHGCYASETALDSVAALRKLLSLEDRPPIDEVIESGVVPHLVNLLTVDTLPRLQFEAAWCLTNIASGTATQTAHVVAANGIPAFCRLLSSPAEDAREQAIWALGNIAGDSATLRDAVLAGGALQPLLAQIVAGPKLSLLRNSVWVLSNLCRGKPAPALESVSPALPVLAELLASCADEESLSDTLWAISYLTDGDDERIGAAVQAGIAAQLVRCLTHTSSKLKVPALRAIGNIVTGSDAHTQAIVSAGALPILGVLVTQGAKTQERKEACWAISNIAAGTASQLAAVLASGVLLPVATALRHAEFEIKKEACWVVCNAVHGSSQEQALFIAEQYGVLEPMVQMLGVADARMVGITLDFLDNLLKAGEAAAAARGDAENRVVVWLDECGGVDKLEELQEHKNEDIYKKAVSLLETYLGEDTDEDAAAAPCAVANSQQFAFGLTPGMSAVPAFAF